MFAYIYQADIYCADCAGDIKAEADADLKLDALDKQSSDHYPQGPYPDGGGEADYPQHCDSCGVFLQNPLTRDGEAYVRDAVTEVQGLLKYPPCLDEWADFYDYLRVSPCPPEPEYEHEDKL